MEHVFVLASSSAHGILVGYVKRSSNRSAKETTRGPATKIMDCGQLTSCPNLTVIIVAYVNCKRRTTGRLPRAYGGIFEGIINGFM